MMPADPPTAAEERTLVLAPLGRDAAIAANLLREGGLAAHPCRDLADLMTELGVGAGCLVFTQEAVQTADLAPLVLWLKAQPLWSDMPVIVITPRGGGPESNPAALRLIDALGNVTFMERPFRPLTFVSVVRSALRSRRRQLHARGQMAELAAREAALRESEARFRMLADNIPVLAWAADAEGRVHWYNSRWYQYTGTSAEDMEGRGWHAVHDPAYLPAILDQWRAAVRSGEPLEMVFPLRGADGAFRPFLTRVMPLKEDGRVVRWFGTNVDISAERAAEAAIRASEERLRTLNQTLERQVAERTARLRESEARLRAIFESSYQAQCLLTPEGTVLDANATSLRLIGQDIATVAGVRLWDTPWFAATPGLPATLRQAIARVREGGSFREELPVSIAGQMRTLDVSLRAIRDQGSALVAILAEAADVTERRQAEEALRQAQKMEAIGQLTGGIAHDFNNMLQGIVGGVEMMERRLKSGHLGDAEYFIGFIQKSARRAATLVEHLLAFSRRQVLAPQNVNLDLLIGSVADLLRNTVGPEIDVKVALQDSSWQVRCDPNQLESALLNLAINARDAMAARAGELVVTTAHVRLDAAAVAGWDRAQPGEYVRITVRDTGTGMSPEVLDRAFEPFFTTKPTGQGTGLGLSQVFGFVSQSGGVVRIDSRVGEGTAVHLFLPRSIAADPAERGAATTRGAEHRYAPATVLLVEDEDNLRQLAAEALRDAGYTVLVAKDGPDGLGILRRARSDGANSIDLMVSDIGLPGGLNGRELAEAARAVLPSLPVLLVTGYSGDALAGGVLDTGRMELLRKPFDLELLAERVAAMLHRQNERSHVVAQS